MKAPNRLDFAPEQIDELIDRLNNECLRKEDYPLLADLLRAMVWLNFSLQEKKLTIKRLRAVFGIKTESAKKLWEFARGKSSAPENPPAEDLTPAIPEDADGKEADANQSETSEEGPADDKTPKDKPKNHGHRPAAGYTQAKTIEIAHEALKKGGICPSCLKGRLFQLKPGTVIRIIGQPWLQVEIYRPERLRCSLCGKVFTAILPKEVATDSRADCTAKAIVSLLKYRGGVPFYRQEQIQKILGNPISASEIWEMTEDVANAAMPIYAAMCQEAANAELIQNDDTSARILSVMKELKEAEEKPERVGTFTTAILATLKKAGVKIALFFTGRKHAGENLDDLLKGRSEGLPPPIQECDALSRNVPKDHDTQLGNCLAHSRRDFYELVEVWPRDVTRIIGYFSSVFANDDSAPEDPQERLKWHQEKSGPVMREMKDYCNGLVERKEVEPNSSMGKAIAYLNNHWEALTLFLRVPGVPLTNNDTERLIKQPVLNRKNAYFFRNETGAKIADILMSVMETCALNNVNPCDFLTAIQKHREDVHQYSALWVPWAYENRLKELRSP